MKSDNPRQERSAARDRTSESENESCIRSEQPGSDMENDTGCAFSPAGSMSVHRNNNSQVIERPESRWSQKSCPAKAASRTHRLVDRSFRFLSPLRPVGSCGVEGVLRLLLAGGKLLILWSRQGRT